MRNEGRPTGTATAHEELVELLAGYVDGMLPAPERSRVEAHLEACEPCRRSVALQEALKRRLEQEPVVPAPALFRQRALEAVHAAARSGAKPLHRQCPPSWPRRTLPWLGWAVAAVLAVLLAVTPGPATQSGTMPPPMVEAALEDFRATMADELVLAEPDLARLSAHVGFPVRRLEDPRLRLLSGWAAEIRGTPAVVLAYRWREQIILQYLVSEELFFRQPEVREAVKEGGRYTRTSGKQSVIAWPLVHGGSLLVAEAPPQEVARLQL